MGHISLKEQLEKIVKDNPKQLRTKDGRGLNEILEEEAERLRKLIEREIDLLYERKYVNPWYPRTGMFKKALCEAVSVDDKTIAIIINFKPEYSWHESWITKTQDENYDNKGFVPLLMNEGFKTLDGGYFDGTRYIENAIKIFNQTKRKGITVKLQKTFEGTTYFNDYV